MYSSQLKFYYLGICEVVTSVSDQLYANYDEQYQLGQYNGESIIIITRGEGGWEGLVESPFVKKQMRGEYYKY